MDWAAAKERNCEALLRVLAMLFAVIGLVRGGSVATVSRHLKLRVLRHLRTAESAVRRLLIIEAQGADVTVPAARAAEQGQPKSQPKHIRVQRVRGFSVIEPLQRTAAPAPRYAAGPGPRMFFFDGSDPVIDLPVAASPDDAVDAERLCLRLHRLREVLDDLPKYAARVALWNARRAAVRAGRSRVIRPGRPPGFRARGQHPVDGILRECHELALYALKPPDTS